MRRPRSTTSLSSLESLTQKPLSVLPPRKVDTATANEVFDLHARARTTTINQSSFLLVSISTYFVSIDFLATSLSQPCSILTVTSLVIFRKTTHRINCPNSISTATKIPHNQGLCKPMVSEESSHCYRVPSIDI